MFSYIGIGINFFLLILLLSKRGKTAADKILAGWLIVIGCHLVLFALNLEPASVNNIHWLLGTSIPFPFLHGPFLYLYTSAMTNRLPENRKWLILHFFPAIIACAFFIPVFLLSGPEKMEFLQSGAKEYAFSNWVRGILIQVSGFVYVIWCLLLLQKHKINIQREFSYEERISLNWLRYLIYGLAAIWVIIIFFQHDRYIFAGVVVFVILLGYFGIKQPGIFTQPDNAEQLKNKDNHLPAFEIAGHPDVQSDLVSNEAVDTATDTAPFHVRTAGITGSELINSELPARKKYERSGISAAQSLEIQHRLAQIMKMEKLYREPALSLSMLAGKLSVHPNTLSQVINEREGKTFFEYVNVLRVEEFKRLIENPENRQFTMMSLAYDCGFNSKTAFYRNFKNISGQTPSDYLKEKNIQILAD